MCWLNVLKVTSEAPACFGVALRSKIPDFLLTWINLTKSKVTVALSALTLCLQSVCSFLGGVICVCIRVYLNSALCLTVPLAMWWCKSVLLLVFLTKGFVLCCSQHLWQIFASVKFLLNCLLFSAIAPHTYRHVLLWTRSMEES